MNDAEIDAWVESLLSLSDDDALAAIKNRPSDVTLLDIEIWCCKHMKTEGANRLSDFAYDLRMSDDEIDAWVESLLALSDDDVDTGVENRPSDITLRDIQEWCWEHQDTKNWDSPITKGIQRLLGVCEELGPPRHDWRCSSSNCLGCE